MFVVFHSYNYRVTDPGRFYPNPDPTFEEKTRFGSKLREEKKSDPDPSFETKPDPDPTLEKQPESVS